jgi:hypothetical protein
VDSLAEVFGDTNEPSVMGCGGACGVAGKGTHGVTNVEATGNVGVEELAENAAVGETELLFEGGSGWCARGWSCIGVDGTRESLREGIEVVVIAFVQVGLVPLVSLEEASDVRTAGDLDIVSGLSDIDTVESGDEAAVGDFDLGADLCDDPFGGGLVGACNGEIVHLSTQENLKAVDRGSVETALVSSCGKTNVKKNPIDVFFPEIARFGVALKRAGPVVRESGPG